MTNNYYCIVISEGGCGLRMDVLGKLNMQFIILANK